VGSSWVCDRSRIACGGLIKIYELAA
jgi:hypothetical protein